MCDIMTYSLIFLGILIGLLIEKYLFPIFDTSLEVFNYKQSEKATIYQLNAQEQAVLFSRKYPESSNMPNQELSPAIGFMAEQSDEMYYDYDDEEDVRSRK